jgi:hypothetical protein
VLGAWQGPIDGELGVLTADADGQRILCYTGAAIRFAHSMNGSFGGIGSKLVVLRGTATLGGAGRARGG